MTGPKVKKMDTQPKKKFNAGNVSVALWENKVMANGNGQPQTILKATVSRRYQDKAGNWQTSASFSRNDIPVIVYLLNQAFAAMLEKGRAEEEIDAAMEEERV
jgi:hypothetical protein